MAWTLVIITKTIHIISHDEVCVPLPSLSGINVFMHAADYAVNAHSAQCTLIKLRVKVLKVGQTEGMYSMYSWETINGTRTMLTI